MYTRYFSLRVRDVNIDNKQINYAVQQYVQSGGDILDTRRLANEVSKVCHRTEENNEPSSSDEEHDMPLLDDEELQKK